MRALTAKELADILFQTPDRVTAGVLEKRSFAEKLGDEFFTHADKRSQRPSEPGPLEKLSRKLFLHFDEVAKVAPEHPRSLKKAALELKVLGFSNRQIEEIESISRRFILTQCEPDAYLKDIFAKDHPGHSYEWCGKAFLGAALVPVIAEKPKTREELFAQVDAYNNNSRDTSKTKNTLFTPEREAQAYGHFQEYVALYVERNGPSLFLTPAKPRQRYEEIAP